MKKLLLASKSPRRQEILKNAGFNFSIIESEYKETLDDKEFSYEKIEVLAKNKGFGALPNAGNNSYIISADTVVVLNNKILTKPTDKKDAFSILKSLSGKEHKVVTSICIIDVNTQEFIIESTTTTVKFAHLTDEMIDFYIEEYKPFDKAGAYGIQEMPENYIKNVIGDIENVIGLSSRVVKEAISTLELHLKQSQEKYVYPQD